MFNSQYIFISMCMSPAAITLYGMGFIKSFSFVQLYESVFNVTFQDWITKPTNFMFAN